MRLVAITRIRNEDDIVEAFARHHRTIVDHHVFLDNGSNDRTVAILRSLQAEGFPITIFASRAVTYTEALHSSVMLQLTVQRETPDWVIFLDADEFLDLRVIGPFLGVYLERVSPAVGCVKMSLWHYHRTQADDPAEPVVPVRLRRRLPEQTGQFKVIVRSGVIGENISIAAGNHDVLYNGQPIGAEIHPDVRLAHYPERSPWQALSKMVIGRLKVLAAGQREIMLHRNSHYDPVLSLLRESPQTLLLNPDYIQGLGTGQGLVDDPIEYHGGPFKYTEPTDPRLHAVQSLLAYTESLADEFGKMVDAHEVVREQIDRQSLTFSHLV